MMRKIVVAALAQSARDMLVAERAFAEREVDRLRDEVEWLMRDRDRLLGALRELQSAVRARQKADAEVARLYRERDIARAWAVERDPSAALKLRMENRTGEEKRALCEQVLGAFNAFRPEAALVKRGHYCEQLSSTNLEVSRT